MKKSVLMALPLLVASVSVNAAGEAGMGTVNFDGTIIVAPCSIASESLDQTVSFGALTTSYLDAGNNSANVPFNIELVNCEAAVTGASITFAGQTVAATPHELVTAGVTKTAIQITAAGNPVQFGTPVPLGQLAAGNNTLQFGSHVKKAAAATATAVGDFTAVSNFTMVYP